MIEFESSARYTNKHQHITSIHIYTHKNDYVVLYGKRVQIKIDWLAFTMNIWYRNTKIFMTVKGAMFVIILWTIEYS